MKSRTRYRRWSGAVLLLLGSAACEVQGGAFDDAATDTATVRATATVPGTTAASSTTAPATTVSLAATDSPATADAPATATAGATSPTPPARIDSVFPVEEEIRRFRSTLGDPVDALSGGSASRDELIRRFLRALKASDRAGLIELSVNAEEFAYLYYPESRFARPPYRMSPELLWFQLENASSAGLRRAIERFGGREMRLEELNCEGEPEIAGETRLWSGCSVRVLLIRPAGAEGSRPSEEQVELSLFAGILERSGHYKVFGYGNRL